MYSFFLPLYSFWCMDDFSWGNTRLVVGEGNNKKVIMAEDEKFDESMIPLKKFSGMSLPCYVRFFCSLSKQSMRRKLGKLDHIPRMKLATRATLHLKVDRVLTYLPPGQSHLEVITKRQILVTTIGIRMSPGTTRQTPTYVCRTTGRWPTSRSTVADIADKDHALVVPRPRNLARCPSCRSVVDPARTLARITEATWVWAS